MAVLLHSAYAQSGANVTITNIPAAATRAVLAVDGGAISGYTTAAQDFAAGTSSVTMSLGIPAGGPYRIRALAYDGTSAWKQALRSGKASGVTVASGSPVSVTIAVSDLSVMLDPGTPSAASAGTTASIRFNIADSGDVVEGSYPVLYYDSAVFSIGAGGRYSSSSAVQKAGAGSYWVTLNISVPSSGTVVYYAMNYVLPAIWGGVRLYSPNPAGTPWHLAMTAGSGVNLSITNIPASATRVIVVVDGGSIADYATAQQDFPAGASSVTIPLGIPAGSPYRIRVLAYDAAATYKQALRSGKVSGISIAPGATVPAAVVLSDVTVAPDAATPASASAGSSVTVRFNIADAGDIVEGSSPVLFFDPALFTIGVGGRYSASGILQHSGEGTYWTSLTMSIPASGSAVYYALNYPLSTKWGGARLYSPAPVSNALPWQMAIKTGSVVNLTVTNIPASATRVMAVVDGGTYVTGEADFPAGTSSVTMPLAVAAGSSYRIRAMAYDSGSTWKPILRSGKATGIAVGTGASTAAAVVLSDVAVTLDSSTPASAAPGTAVNVRFNIADSGDILEGSSPVLYFDQTQFAVEAGGRFSTSSSAVRMADGSYDITLTMNLPAAGSIVYYAINYSLGSAWDSVRLYSKQCFLTLGSTAAPLRFVPVTPCRVVDTRNPAGPFGGPALNANSRDFPITSGGCGIPATAAAFSVNVTVVPLGYLGYLTLWPTGNPRPNVSTLNSHDGRIKANAAIVPAGVSGSVSVYATEQTEVILDINGYFVQATDPAGLAFYPVTPCRLVDTRLANGPLGGPALVGGQPRDFVLNAGTCGIPSIAQAFSLNYTGVPNAYLGYLATWPTGASRPLVSTLNAHTGQITANAAIVPAGTNGAVSVFVTESTHLVIDINGYFAPPGAGGLSFYAVNPCRLADTRLAAGPVGGPSLLGQRSFPVSQSGCGLPSSAQAYSLNATVVPQSGMSYLALWPTGLPMPLVSTLNWVDDNVVSNAAIVPDTNGSINAYVSMGTDLVLDTNGYFAP